MDDEFNNEDSLTSDELLFLEDATRNGSLTKSELREASENEDGDDEILLHEPRFPKIAVIACSVIMVAVFMFVASMMNPLSRYSQLFGSDMLRQAVNTKDGKELGLDKAYTAAQIYQFRIVIYIMVVFVAAVIIGAVIMIWVIRHRRWEQLVMSDDWELVDDADEPHHGRIEDDPGFAEYLAGKYPGLKT